MPKFLKTTIPCGLRVPIVTRRNLKFKFTDLKCHFGTSSWDGTRKLPLAFTEHGILMLSSVLNSTQAIQVNIQIMRTFTKLRELMTTHKDLRRKIKTMEKKYGHQLRIVFNAIKRLIDPPSKQKNPIGFTPNKKKDKSC